MDNQGYEPMCGHAIIGSATTVLETGMLPMREPETLITLDTPSGLVRAYAEIDDGRVASVSVQNVPSFVYRSDVMLDVPDLGELTINVAFGGLSFVFVDAWQIAHELLPDNAAHLDELGMRILTVANEKIEVRHPDLPHIDEIIDLRFYVEPGTEGADSRNVVILGDHMVDRSPCGTGTSAETALRHAQGRLDVGKSFVTESIIGTRFRGELVEKTTVGDFLAVIPASQAAPTSPASTASCSIPTIRSRRASAWHKSVEGLETAAFAPTDARLTVLPLPATIPPTCIFQFLVE